MNSAHIFLLSLILLLILAIFTAYAVSSELAICLALLIVSCIIILRPIFLPPSFGDTKVRVLSLLGIFGVAASYAFWSSFLGIQVISLLEARGLTPYVGNTSAQEFNTISSVVVLIFLLAAIWIINRRPFARSLAGTHPIPSTIYSSEHGFHKKLQGFCSALQQHLISVDRDLDWSPHYYAGLEAEVEIVPAVGDRRRRRPVDLQRVLRSDHQTRAFLLLGDPGSGKSVALRKLARDMLDEVGETGRIPIYVNLREWGAAKGSESRWTQEKKPVARDLEDFVVECLKSRGDVLMDEFVDAYFRLLWSDGRLFFIFDSFDEVPDLLDTTNDSWLLEAISELISRFMLSHPSSRGVLASRPFRRPAESFAAEKILEIRPLDDQSIMTALRRFGSFGDNVCIPLFRDRADLVPLVRNPFLLTLLGDWITEKRGLPENQVELYKSYVHNRLQRCSKRLALFGKTSDEVIDEATEIAWLIYASKANGLEANLEELVDRGISGVSIDILKSILIMSECKHL